MPAQLAIRRWANRPAPLPGSTVLLERHKLLGTECLIVDLARSLNQILQVGTSQEVPQRNKFAMVLILDVDHSPAILPTSNRAPAYDDVVLGTDHGEGDQVFDIGVESALFFILLVIVVGVHAQIMEDEFFLNPLFEGHAFLECQGVRFGDNGDDVDDVGEFL